MKNICINSIFFLFGISCFSQMGLKETGHIQSIFNNDSIKNLWVDVTLDHPVSGTILFYKPAQFYCGILATASLTIIQEGNGDSLRVITLCNMSKEFQVGQRIIVFPDTKPSFGVTLPFTEDNEINNLRSYFFDRTVLRTTFGGLKITL